MLGRLVEVIVDRPLCVQPGRDRRKDALPVNYGYIPRIQNKNGGIQRAYLMGLQKPVRRFNGRVIAIFSTFTGDDVWIVAPVHTCFYEPDIRHSLAFRKDLAEAPLKCLYEKSCGAVVFRRQGTHLRFLVIKNVKGKNWGFPKGHVEFGETEQETALREIMEETGLQVRLFDGFRCSIQYSIWGRASKQVVFFLAETQEEKVVMQESEIERYAWLSLHEALEIFRFENDRRVLRCATGWLKKNKKIFP